MAMGYLLLTCRLESSEATIDKAAPIVGVEPSALDPDFGVVLIDPAGNRYAMMVDERDVGRALEHEGVEGPFANPKIDPAVTAVAKSGVNDSGRINYTSIHTVDRTNPPGRFDASSVVLA